jgi:YggT family protein
MATVLINALRLISIVFVMRALVSWIRVGPDSPFRPIVDGLYAVTEPVLAPLRRILPPLGGIDLSVLLVIIGINYVIIPIIARAL